jgi:hypothetical protein
MDVDTTIDRALSDSVRTLVTYVDPYPGLDENMNEVTCTRATTFTVEDAVKIERKTHKELRPDLPNASDKELLMDFMIVHWAKFQFVDE